MTRYLLGFIFALILIILVVILLLTGVNKSGISYGQQINKFAKYSTSSAESELIINGPIVASTKHNEVIIRVSKFDVNLIAISGYNNNIIINKTYLNSQNSYNAFLRALAINGFNLSNSSATTLTSPVGLCSGGDTYEFKMKLYSKNIVNSWQTNCYNVAHTFNGNFNATVSLFQAQVPNYYSDVSNLNL